ncbi:unnamed protein product, partial [Prorocentrum cordatum]
RAGEFGAHRAVGRALLRPRWVARPGVALQHGRDLPSPAPAEQREHRALAGHGRAHLQGAGAARDEGLFEPVDSSRKLTAIFWKGRFKRFQDVLATFMEPFCGREIREVEQADEVAYVKCHLCTDVLCEDSKDTPGVYLEVEVPAPRAAPRLAARTAPC